MKRLLEALALRRRYQVYPDAARHTITVRSSLDNATQPCVFIPTEAAGLRPLLVYLHPWRHGYDFDCRPWSREAATRGWHFAAPHFRGPNRRPEACASRLARRDAIDAVDAACARVAVDTARIYAGGVSGGGHMALIMAAEAPERWAAVSAWSPISDLAAFYVESVESGAKVHRHIAKIVGGAPSASPHIDAELRFRSPRFQLGKAAALPIDINHGVHDGVPNGIGIQHSIWAFNALAEALGTPPVTDDELVRLLRREYDGAERVDDPTYGRTVYFRRTAGRSRVTLFDGGHEDLPAAACTWFAQHATHL